MNRPASVIVPPRIKEIYEQLGRGQNQFLSDNSYGALKELYYELCENLEDYNAYLEPLGYSIHCGNGFLHMITTTATSKEVGDKSARVVQFIEMYYLLLEALDGLESGQTIFAHVVEHACNSSSERAERLARVSSCTSPDASMRDHVQSILVRFVQVGFLREELLGHGQYIVLSSINYVKEFIQNIEVEAK